MYDLLLVGSTQYLVSVWVLLISLLVMLLILFWAIVIHLQKNRFARIMDEKDQVYLALVNSIRTGTIPDDQIRDAIPLKDFRYFTKYLQETISSTDLIDVSVEKQIAEIIGFIPYQKKLILRSRGWRKIVAVRVLTYFRDPLNAELFNDVLEKARNSFLAYAAGIGLALCGDLASFDRAFAKLLSFFNRSEEALLSILEIYGENIVPNILNILKNSELESRTKIMLINFIGESDRTDARDTIWEMFRIEAKLPVLTALISVAKGPAEETDIGKILPYLQNEDPLIQIEALHALARSGGATYLDQLEKQMSNSNSRVRYEAAHSIFRIGEIGARRLKEIENGDDELRCAAARNILLNSEFKRLPLRKI